MATTATDQTALDEQVVEDSELEKMLEDREKAKGAAGEARKKLKTLDDLSKNRIADLDLKDGDAVRCGRFRIAQREVAARSVAFDVDASSRLTIKPVTED